MPQTAQDSSPTPESFSVLFIKMSAPEHEEVVRASEEMARTSETVRVLSEAIHEIERPAYTTYVSA